MTSRYIKNRTAGRSPTDIALSSILDHGDYRKQGLTVVLFSFISRQSQSSLVNGGPSSDPHLFDEQILPGKRL